MPSEKRNHGRITSGNFRPHKAARFRHEPEENDGCLANDDSDIGMSLDDQPYINPVPLYPSLNGTCSTSSFDMRVTQVLAWPNDFAAVKTDFLYNLTPQDGPRLPNHVLEIVSNRIVRTSPPSTVDDLPLNPPYLHLGFTPFLDLHLFVFLPNLALSNCDYHDPGFIHDAVLERWTDTVFLPSIANNDPKVPSSWRLANHYKRSPAWYNEEIAPYPVSKVYDGQGTRSFSKIWQRILQLSMKILEFQHPFLLLYSSGESSQVFFGSRPEDMMLEFEKTWHQHVDMKYIEWPEDNLMVDFDYGNSMEIRDLPMR